MNNKSSGFTLTELLVVMGIIAFLAVISLVYLRQQIFKARDARRKADMHLIQNAVEEYEKDNDCYPPEENLLCDAVTFSVVGDGLIPYLDKIPCDPISGGSYPYEPGGPTSCYNWYRMYALLDTGEYTIYGPGGVGYDYYVSSPNAPVPSPMAISTPTPTSAPAGDGGPYWGCINGSCESVSGPPYCSPKFGSDTCYWQCRSFITGEPINECE